MRIATRLSLSRRTLLRGAALSTLVGLVTRPGVARALSRRKAKRAVLVWLAGGPSHLDTFDPKPGTATGGPFQAIATGAEGMQICEHLPRLAEVASHFSLVRSLHSREADHGRATYLLTRGHLPEETVDHPALCSVAAHLLDTRASSVPAFVTIPYAFTGPGFLGVEWSSLVVGDPDTAAQLFRRPEGLTEKRAARRRDLLGALDERFASRSDRSQVASERGLQERAHALLGPEAVETFDLSLEPEGARARYGQTPFGGSCLLARRALEHGVRFVELVLDGWDTHENNFEATKERMSVLDPALAALLEDLAASGLLDETLVLCMGEFGRTPDINATNGRDHHASAFSALVAGGGIQGGRVIGATDAEGREPAERPVSVPDLFATLYRACGIDPGTTLETDAGRPIRLVDKGAPIEELFA